MRKRQLGIELSSLKNGMISKQGKLARNGKILRKLLIWGKYLFFIFIALCNIILALVTIHNFTPLKFSNHKTNLIDVLSLKLGLQESIYVIVIDSGSTGTRLLLFNFYRLFFDESLKLHNEDFHEIKPGVSSFVNKPEKIEADLHYLLNKAKDAIIPTLWSETPVIFKATAGLRMLPENESSFILNLVKNILETFPFKISEDSISILDGIDEGLFSWFTVNFLLEGLHSFETQNIVALDLGGGSTQIAFATQDPHKFPDAFADSLIDIKLFGQKIYLYIKSYQQLGLLAARLAILRINHTIDDFDLQSSCINPIVDYEWHYGEKVYQIRGLATSSTPSYKMKRPAASFSSCFEAAEQLLANRIYQPKGLEDKILAAFSFYFDRASEIGLIDPFEGGTVTVEQFLKAAKEVCCIPNVEQPFICVDLTYISALLLRGFGFSLNQKLQLYKKINGHETSWALGAAFHYICNHFHKS